MNRPHVSLFVLDTGPLITLAAADSLDYLLFPNVPVVIPDAVFYEATRDVGKLGAQSVLDWVKAHRTQVEIAVTETYAVYDAARQINPVARMPNMGEQAAIEVIEEPGRLQGDEVAILLCEEAAITSRITVNQPDLIIEMTTMDLLRALEKEQRINSADAVFDRALAAGRTPSRIEKFADHDPAIRDAVRETLAAARRERIPSPKK
jgi:hypothetical protein